MVVVSNHFPYFSLVLNIWSFFKSCEPLARPAIKEFFRESLVTALRTRDIDFLRKENGVWDMEMFKNFNLLVLLTHLAFLRSRLSYVYCTWRLLLIYDHLCNSFWDRSWINYLWSVISIIDNITNQALLSFPFIFTLFCSKLRTPSYATPFICAISLSKIDVR